MRIKATRFCMFSGLVHVRIPAGWVADESKVRWYAKDGVQYVDFSANGGPAFAFSDSISKPGPGVYKHWQTTVIPAYREVDPATITEWGDLKTGGLYVSSLLFGASDDIIDLVPPQPLPKGEPLIFPPAQINGVDMDTTTPLKYIWVPDGMGGGGYQVVIARTKDGRLISCYDSEKIWYGFHDETPYGEALASSYKTATTMRSWEWMVLDGASLEEFLAAYKRREYEGQRKLPESACMPFIPDGMTLWYAYVQDGVARIYCNRRLSLIEVLKRQVSGHKYVPHFAENKAKVTVSPDRFVDYWDEVTLVTVKLVDGKLIVSGKRDGDHVSLGNRSDTLLQWNKRRLRELRAAQKK